MGKIEVKRVVGQVPQKGDLCQRFNGEFRSVGADGNALVFLNAVVEFAGQMQAVEAGLVLDFNAGGSPCRKGSGGIYCDQVVALAAVKEDAADGEGLAVQRAGDEVNRGLQKILREAEVPAAADAESVLAVAAVHSDIGRAQIHSEAEFVQGIALGVGIAEEGHDHIAGVNELNAAHVLAVAEPHVHAHSGGSAQIAADTVHKDTLQRINVMKNIREPGVGVDEGGQLAEEVDVRLGCLHGCRNVGLSSHFQRHRVIARAAVHLDMDRVCPGIARYVGYAEVDRVILLCTVVLHAVRIIDADGIAGGQIQSRKQDVEPLDVDVDAALQLYIALGLRVDIHDLSLLILHDGVLRHDANGQVAAQGGGVFHVQKLLDQSGQNTIRTLFTQIQAVKIQSVLNHNGGNAFFPSRLLVFVQVAQIGQRVRHGLVDGVAVVVGGVDVLDLFADLMDIGAARGNGVGLYLHLILGNSGLRLGRVIFPGRSAGQYAGSSRARRSGCGSGIRALGISSRSVRTLRISGRNVRALRIGSWSVHRSGRAAFTLGGVSSNHHGAEGEKAHHGADQHPHRASFRSVLHPCFHVHPFFLGSFRRRFKLILTFTAFP